MAVTPEQLQQFMTALRDLEHDPQRWYRQLQRIWILAEERNERQENLSSEARIRT